MGLFNNLKDATYSKRGNYMEPNARYLLELMGIEVGKTFGGDEHCIFTFKVVETSATKDKPGDEVSFYCANYGKAKPNFLGNVKKVMVALYGTINGQPVSPNDIGEPEAEALMGVKGALAGTPVAGALPGTAAAGTRVEARTKQTMTKAKTEFTVIDFYPVI